MRFEEGSNSVDMHMIQFTIMSLEFTNRRFCVFDTECIAVSKILFHCSCSDIKNDLLSLLWLPVCQDVLMREGGWRFPYVTMEVYQVHVT